MTKRSVLLTAVPLALLAVCAAVLLLACGTVLSQEYLSARPDSTVEAAVPFSPTKSSILRGPAIAAFLRKCSAAPHRGPTRDLTWEPCSPITPLFLDEGFLRQAP